MQASLLTLLSGVTKNVVQLHCENWPDMEAPKDTAVLLDLIEHTQRVYETMSGTMLVHCSAGVGRTGTYIGLYKLIQDYHNDKVGHNHCPLSLISLTDNHFVVDHCSGPI